MDEQNITSMDANLKILDQKLDAIYKSVEKTRKYFMWTLIMSIVFFILPLIGIAFVIPVFLSGISQYSLF